MSEDAMILAHIQTHGSITPAEAYAVAGCLAMHSAAARLRKVGYEVACTMRSGNGKRWGEYTISEPIPFAGLVQLGGAHG